MSRAGPTPIRRRPALAMAEVLRAPLLLSPVADVLAGASVAIAAWAPRASALRTDVPAREITLAAVAGIALLAAGMAQNALVDLEEDRRRKPDRPLPAGRVSPRAVRSVHVTATLAGLLAAGVLSRGALTVAAAIVALTFAYHHALKRRRVSGCLALGALRALDMGLGMAAASVALGLATSPSLSQVPWTFPALYGVYIAGAALHASTDDQPLGPDTRAWSRGGLSLAGAVLLVLSVASLAGTEWQFRFGGSFPQTGHAAGLILLLALGRLIRASLDQPRPVVTGVALSGLYLLQAAVAAHFGERPDAGVVILLLFFASRLMLRLFPPS